jgi:hypothetical protein
MRYPSSSRRSYREVLIAAGLTAALGVGSACAEPGAGTAPQPRADGQTPNGQNPSNGSADRSALAPPPGAHITTQGSRR